MHTEIKILPIGSIESFLLKSLKMELAKIFSCKVELVSPIKEKFEYAYDDRRNQYYSDIILEKIPSSRHEGKRVLSIVNVDLCVPGLNFVFGVADAIKGVCIISLFRLRQEYYGLEQDKALLTVRTLKEAIHELGHTYGLSHCGDSKCVMFFSNSLRDTDRKKAQFCARCNGLIVNID